MLTFFTDPYPEELLYSAFARYHNYIGNVDLLDTIDELFGKRTIIPNLYLGSNLQYLCNELNGPYSSDDLINNHTVFPFYKLFLPLDRQIQLVNEMKFGNCEGMYISLGLASGGICRIDGIRYCSECVKFDINKYGEPYIHREHQLQGILICPHHKTILSEYKFNRKNTSRLKYIKLEEAELNFNKDAIKIDADINYEKLIKLSQMAYRLISLNLQGVCRDDILNCYKDLLFEKGFKSVGNRIYQNDLYYEFTRFYGNNFLRFLECEIDINYDYNWLKVITRKTKRTSHPLRHLLLINFLVGNIDSFIDKINVKYNPFGNGPWPCLNKVADHYKQDVIRDVIITSDYKAPVPVGTFECSCGFIYARKGPDKSPGDRYKIGKTKSFGHVWTEKLINLLKEGVYSSRQLAEIMGCDPNTIRKKANELNMNYFSLNRTFNSQINNEKQELKSGHKIEEFKNKVLEAVETNKCVGKLKLRSLMPNEIRYISKYDKDWINGILSSREFHENNKKSTKIDWDKRDSIYLSLVEAKYKEIYNRVPYQRATKSAIGTELGIRNILYNNSDKIPNTILFIQQNQESVEQFRIRRCNNIIKSFKQDDEPIQLWKVQRIAGIDSHVFNELKGKLD